MIYLDTSVFLAHVLGETRRPPDRLWSEVLVSSRLLDYEAWTRVHAYGLGATHGSVMAEALRSLGFLELVPIVLARARDPFPTAVRTLDALHLATLDFLQVNGFSPRILTWDRRLLQSAEAIGVARCDIDT